MIDDKFEFWNDLIQKMSIEVVFETYNIPYLGDGYNRRILN